MSQSDFFQLQQEHIKVLKEFTLLRDANVELRDANVELRENQTNLLNQLSMVVQTLADLRAENQMLKDEIARLKNISPRPKIPPNGLEGSSQGSGNKGGNKGNPGRGKHPRKSKKGLAFHQTQRVKPETIPEGAIFKGTRKYSEADF